MGIKTVAEHVESEAAADRLAELGVDYAQGDYYAAPALVHQGDLCRLAATPRRSRPYASLRSYSGDARPRR